MVIECKDANADLKARAWQIAANVPDPEIPVITLGELGILRDVVIDEEGRACIHLTPTYSGCPAVQVIEEDVADALKVQGINNCIVRVISPPWTTDWITKSGRKKLTAYGIAPPKMSSDIKPALFSQDNPDCPRCKSSKTKLISQFGSTPCKSHFQCLNCQEPFDYFKCL